LLAAVVDELAQRGLGDVSLRPLATALGVSTYTLSYHFGSKEGLLAEALEYVEAQQAELVRQWTYELGQAHGADAASLVERYWGWVSQPENLARVRLVFDAIASPASSELLAPGLRRRLMSAWVELIGDELRRAGLPRPRAITEATLAASALAGMVLDLLATGDQRRLGPAARALGQHLNSLTALAK
jgi:AcrR family transcriptional regulator